MLKQFKVSINEIYLEDFLKVTVLNHSSKEQQSDPFIKHPVHSLILAEKEQKWMLKPYGVRTNEIYQEDFLKVAVLNRSTKGAMHSSFHKAPCSLFSISRKQAKMKCLSNLE